MSCPPQAGRRRSFALYPIWAVPVCPKQGREFSEIRCGTQLCLGRLAELRRGIPAGVYKTRKIKISPGRRTCSKVSPKLISRQVGS
jgi:hypothetical protein